MPFMEGVLHKASLRVVLNHRFRNMCGCSVRIVHTMTTVRNVSGFFRVAVFVCMVFCVAVLMFLLSSCAAVPVRMGESPSEQDREEIVRYAEGLIGYSDLTAVNGYYRNDCSGFVIGVYESLGYSVKLDPQRGARRISELLYRTLRARGYTYTYEEPGKGDAVFFMGTIPGSANRISHMGMVVDVLSDGTVIIVHYGSKGVGTIRMNLYHPHIHIRNGNVINDFLRKSDSSPSAQRLSGELFYSFGDLYAYAS